MFRPDEAVMMEQDLARISFQGNTLAKLEYLLYNKARGIQTEAIPRVLRVDIADRCTQSLMFG